MKCDSDGDNYGATCNFKCTGGYELQGSAARVCQSALSWSGAETNCLRTYCQKIHTFFSVFLYTLNEIIDHFIGPVFIKYSWVFMSYAIKAIGKREQTTKMFERL